MTGTQDFQIQVQKEDVVIWNVKETAPITIINNFGIKQFAYSVDNGTLGVYENKRRLWRVKVRHNEPDQSNECILNSLFVASQNTVLFR